MKICPICKETYVDFGFNNYCTLDGTKLNEFSDKCECGRTMYPADKFCPNCGKQARPQIKEE